MKIVLKENVKKLGKKGEIKSVSDGYARNFLIPNALAIKATGEALKIREKLLLEEKKKETDFLKKADEINLKLTKIKPVLKMKAKEDGTFYGSIKKEDIAAAISKEINEDFDSKFIELEEPIKKVGEHDIAVEVLKDKKTVVKVIAKEE